jgi:hypothetical protein
MMRVETGSRNDVQEVSEMQRIEPLFLGSHPGYPDELACDAVRVLGCTSMFDAAKLAADDAYPQVRTRTKRRGSITLLANWGKTRVAMRCFTAVS